jgi:hypothetical protein
MNTNLFLMIIWGICLLQDIITFAAGGQPSWVKIFCTDIAIVLKFLLDYLEDKYNKLP